ncbi:MAG: 30S ribosomal protein S17 [Candidatus Euphemobacter frigidus]|nr:30S ribosomal protein S17 [Candidatus Euphemobacter frigidus]MDP8276195.1 30S ribosomal protein S17 [Candidatus Euphemobacter frigidus]
MKKSNNGRGCRKIRRGTVGSDRMDKTIVVEVIRKFRHPLYKKVIKKTTRFYVHDEKNQAQAGDIVEIMETRPTSKTKRWRLVGIIKQAQPE